MYSKDDLNLPNEFSHWVDCRPERETQELSQICRAPKNGETGADGRQEEGRACDFRGLVLSPLFPRFIVPFFLE